MVSNNDPSRARARAGAKEEWHVARTWLTKNVTTEPHNLLSLSSMVTMDIVNEDQEQSNLEGMVNDSNDLSEQASFRKRAKLMVNEGESSATLRADENSDKDENDTGDERPTVADGVCASFRERYEGPSNLYAVVIYTFVSKNTSGRRFAKSARMAALIISGCGLAFSAVFCLLAVSVTLQWGKCTTADDCKLGLACIRFQDASGNVNRPTCEDCSFFIGPDAADHEMPPSANESSANIPCFDRSRQYYLDTDFDGIYTNNGGSTPLSEEYPASCLYLRYNTGTASRLDIFVYFIVIVIISFHAGGEADQQNRVHKIRYYSMPLTLPGKTLSSWKRFAATLTVCLSEIFQKLMLANMPMALTMLTVTDQVSAANMILDGLAITFFFFIDDIASLVVVRDKLHRHRVEKYTGELELNARASLSNCRDRGKDDVWIITVSTFCLCILAYYGVQRSNSCESILYWLNYRIVVQFGVWFVSAAKEISFLFRRARYHCVHQHDKLPNTRNGWAKVGCSIGGEVVKWFLNTLLIAFTQNILFYFATEMYYDQPLTEAFSDYFWIEVKDVFGACARISWDESFPCASPWPWPGDGDDGL